ncbi:unnamed protein product [Alopecurus aequalis]
MDDGTMAPAPETTQHVPHELVVKILLHLPVESVMRFACVSRTWHDTITNDRCFRSEHHRLQKSYLLIAPRIESIGCATLRTTTTTCLYRWERKSQPHAATLVQAIDPFPAVEARRHTLAHCRGLVLVPTDDGPVRVLNPAMRRVLTLPPTEESHAVMARESWLFIGAFGFGPDRRTETYKVARIFYRVADKLATVQFGYAVGMDVLTIGIDHQWRETTIPPPYPIVGGETATFFKDSLLWKIDENLTPDDRVVRGFLRFNLEDESFSVMPGPPGCPPLKYSTSNLAEIRGELCLAHQKNQDAMIWVCDGAEAPRWVLRHVIKITSCIRLISTSNEDDHHVVFQGLSNLLQCFDSRVGEDAIPLARMDHLRSI